MSTKEQILTLEREFWRQIASGDYTAAAALLAPEAASVSSMGAQRFTPEQYIELGTSSGYAFIDWSMSGEDVIFPTPDTAICTYRSRQTLEKDGQRLTGENMDSSVWTRVGDTWKCILHTQSPAT